MRKKSVILLSGGLDSAANLAICREVDHPILALTIDYGQKAAQRELRAAQEFCRYYDVPHQEVELKWLGALGGSALTQKNQSVPQIQADSLDDQTITAKTASKVWVPNRNGVFIHVAAAFAERMGADHVVVGFNSEEAVTFPDNSTQYLKQVNQALAYSTATQVRVFSYTDQWDKTQIVKELNRLEVPFPFDQVWSCYEGGEFPCGKCESCQRLARAKNALLPS